jgi:3-hydroxyisobutyrate dehydrogenase
VTEIAVLGVGRMGAAMAKRLDATGHSVTVWNRTQSAADDVVAGTSMRVAADPAAAVAAADVVLLMLASGAVTEAVALADEVLTSLRPGALVCDMGTSGVATAHALDSALRAGGHRFVDAPVSGSVPTVAAGQLLVMASGDAPDVAAITPVLASFAKQVVHLGAAGAGQAMKLAVNLIVHSLNAAMSEALVMATRAGITAEAAYDVFQASVIGAPFVQYKRAAFLTDDVPVAMSLELTAKDLGLIADFADQLHLPALASRAVRDEVVAACEAGFEAHDMSALFRHLSNVTTISNSY